MYPTPFIIIGVGFQLFPQDVLKLVDFFLIEVLYLRKRTETRNN